MSTVYVDALVENVDAVDYEVFKVMFGTKEHKSYAVYFDAAKTPNQLCAGMVAVFDDKGKADKLACILNENYDLVHVNGHREPFFYVREFTVNHLSLSDTGNIDPISYAFFEC